MNKNKLFIICAITTIFMTSCGENADLKNLDNNKNIIEEVDKVEAEAEVINPEIELESFKNELHSKFIDDMSQDDYNLLIAQLIDSYSTVKNYPSYDIYIASREVSKKILDNQLTVKFLDQIQLGRLNEFDLNSTDAKRKVYEFYESELNNNLEAIKQSYSDCLQEGTYNDMLIFNQKFELEWLKPLKDTYIDNLYTIVKEDANRLGIEETEYYKSLKLPLMCLDDIILYFALNASEEDIEQIYGLADIVEDDIPEVIHFLTNEIAYYKSDALYSPSEELSNKELHGISETGEMDEFPYIEFTALMDNLLGYSSESEVSTGWVGYAYINADNWFEDMAIFAEYEFPINNKYEQIIWSERMDKVKAIYKAAKSVWEECIRQTNAINEELLKEESKQPPSGELDMLPPKPLNLDELNPYVEILKQALSKDPLYYQDGEKSFFYESIGLIQTKSMGHVLSTIETVRDYFGI